ncbi:hypothetical protein J6590_018255 [Homalodisca vitripennis]|nr:hypothetical protein J6590_018255 [Homalodisca vitripennis]
MRLSINQEFKHTTNRAKCQLFGRKNIFMGDVAKLLIREELTDEIWGMKQDFYGHLPSSSDTNEINNTTFRDLQSDLFFRGGQMQFVEIEMGNVRKLGMGLKKLLNTS